MTKSNNAFTNVNETMSNLAELVNKISACKGVDCSQYQGLSKRIDNIDNTMRYNSERANGTITKKFSVWQWSLGFIFTTFLYLLGYIINDLSKHKENYVSHQAHIQSQIHSIDKRLDILIEKAKK
jgi:hypothetical protein